MSNLDWPNEVKEVLRVSSFVCVFLSMPLGRLGAMKNEARLLMLDPVSDESKERLESLMNDPVSDENKERLERLLDCSLLASVVDSPSDRFIDPT